MEVSDSRRPETSSTGLKQRLELFTRTDSVAQPVK
jgi:hypothetical protein